MNHKEEVSYHNDLFFKYSMVANDEDSKYIRHSIIKELTGIEPVESVVLNTELIPKNIKGKRVVLDLLLKDTQGNTYNIEMQVEGSKRTLGKRFLYYGCKMIEEQMKEGEDYELLKPVYQIIFLYSNTNHRDNTVNLIDSYSMRNEEGVMEFEDTMMRRIYVYLPAINDIVKKKGFPKLTAFEMLCYLFKNGEIDDIMKSEERLVKAMLKKHEDMRCEDSLWSLARAGEMGEMQIRIEKQYMYKDGYAEGEKQGEIKGKYEGTIILLEKQIQMKYSVEASTWLNTLSYEQLTNISEHIFTCDAYEELQEYIKGE